MDDLLEFMLRRGEVLARRLIINAYAHALRGGAALRQHNLYASAIEEVEVGAADSGGDPFFGLTPVAAHHCSRSLLFVERTHPRFVLSAVSPGSELYCDVTSHDRPHPFLCACMFYRRRRMVVCSSLRIQPLIAALKRR
jgi:hypothetical protein